MHADALALKAKERGVAPAAIWHSGKLRAKQTAESFWRACNPLAEFTAVPGLQPSDHPQRIRDRIIGESRDIMLVGHMPSLPKLLHLLLHGNAEAMAGFPQHGIVALEAQGKGWMERWRM